MKKGRFPGDLMGGIVESQNQVASQTKMKARKGMRTQGITDVETFNRKFKETFAETGTFLFRLQRKKAIQVYFEFFGLKLLLFVLFCSFFLTKIKVAIFVIIYEQIIENVHTYR